MGKDIQATIIHSDSTDVITTSKRVEELHRQLAEKELAAQKARQELERFEESTRRHLQNYPELLAEFNAELADLARRRDEQNARLVRVETLRKQRL